jgi:hypothetical protein
MGKNEDAKGGPMALEEQGKKEEAKVGTVALEEETKGVSVAFEGERPASFWGKEEGAEARALFEEEEAKVGPVTLEEEEG